MIDQSELNPNQFPAWAEFTPSSESLTKVSAREGFQLETLIDQNGTPTMARVGAGIIESGYVSGRGWYVKYSDGTMEQRIEHVKLQYNNTSSLAKTITYPVPFNDIPTILIVPDSTAYYTSGDLISGFQIVAPAQINRTNSYGDVTVFCAGAGAPFSSDNYIYVSCILTGRWR